jgi:hypothetical protein
VCVEDYEGELLVAILGKRFNAPVYVIGKKDIVNKLKCVIEGESEGIPMEKCINRNDFQWKVVPINEFHLVSIGSVHLTV